MLIQIPLLVQEKLDYYRWRITISRVNAEYRTFVQILYRPAEQILVWRLPYATWYEHNPMTRDFSMYIRIISSTYVISSHDMAIRRFTDILIPFAYPITLSKRTKRKLSKNIIDKYTFFKCVYGDGRYLREEYYHYNPRPIDYYDQNTSKITIIPEKYSFTSGLNSMEGYQMSEHQIMKRKIEKEDESFKSIMMRYLELIKFEFGFTYGLF